MPFVMSDCLTGSVIYKRIPSFDPDACSKVTFLFSEGNWTFVLQFAKVIRLGTT